MDPDQADSEAPTYALSSLFALVHILDISPRKLLIYDVQHYVSEDMSTPKIFFDFFWKLSLVLSCLNIATSTAPIGYQVYHWTVRMEFRKKANPCLNPRWEA